MKVLNLTHSYPTKQSSNVTPFVRYFVEELGSRDDIDLHLAAPMDTDLLFSKGALHTVRLSPNNNIAHKKIGSDHRSVSKFHQVEYLLKFTYHLRRVLKQEEIDVVHAHWCLPSGLVAYLLKKLTGVPYVVTTHGRDVLNYPEFGYDVPSGRVLSFALKQVLSNCDRVCTTSPTTDESTKSLLPSVQSQTIPVGIEAEWFKIADEFSTGEGFLYVGDLIPRKGADLLVEALGADERLRSIPLCVVGDGPLRSTMEARSKELGLNVEFCGFLGRERLKEKFLTSSALVMPSHIEGFGIVALESLAAGLKLVAARVGAVPLLEEHPVLKSAVFGSTPGDYSSLSKALLRSLDSVSEASFKSVQDSIRNEYSWSEIARQYSEVYTKIVS